MTNNIYQKRNRKNVPDDEEENYDPVELFCAWLCVKCKNIFYKTKNFFKRGNNKYEIIR